MGDDNDESAAVRWLDRGRRDGTAAFRSMMRTCTPADLQDRVCAAFLGGGAGNARHARTVGPLMSGLLHEGLRGMAEGEGYSLEGRVAYDERSTFGGSELGAPAYHTLELSEHEWLDVPLNLSFYLASASERTVISFGTSERQAEIHVASSGDAVGFYQRLQSHVRETHVLRGRAIRPGGRLVQCGSLDWSAIYLPASTREAIDQQLELLRTDRGLIRRLGLRRRRGIILSGPPGTGKTLIGKILAGTLGISFLWVTPGDLTSHAVSEVFELARFLSPCVVFLEDIDLLAEDRATNPNSHALGELMNQLDGCEGDHELITIATTNRPEVLESAIRNRPGRFDRTIEIGPLDRDCRRRMLVDRLAAHAVSADDCDRVARATDGWNGSMLEEMIDTAMMLTLRRGQRPDNGAGLRIPPEALDEALAALEPEHARHAGFGG